MTHAFKSLLALVLVVLSQTSAAQVCDITMSFNACTDALNNTPAEVLRAVEAAVENNKDEAERTLKTVNSGSQTGSDTATEDFNPLLQASLDSTGISDDNSGKLTISWNDFLQSFVKNQFFGDDGSAGSVGQHHKLIVSLEAPEVYEPLKQAISDDSVIGDLENSLGDFDDVAIDLRIALNSQKRGRSINNHLSTLTSIQRKSMSQAAQQLDLSFSADDQVLILIDQISRKTEANFDMDEPFESLATSENEARLLVGLVEEAYNQHVAYAAAYDRFTRQNGLLDLMNLVNNQPQFIFSAKAQLRDEIAGPSEYSARLVYEFGGVNVNTYNRYRNNKCSGIDDDPNADENEKAIEEVFCLTDFTRLNSDAISNGNRFALSAEYTRRDSWSFDDLGVMLDEDEQSSFVSKLTYARNLGFGQELFGVGSRSRIDFSASYDDISSDPMRHDRAIANLTFAQELSSGLFLTVSLEWANKPEFRVDPDEEVSVMAGISYKMPGM